MVKAAASSSSGVTKDTAGEFKNVTWTKADVSRCDAPHESNDRELSYARSHVALLTLAKDATLQKAVAKLLGLKKKEKDKKVKAEVDWQRIATEKYPTGKRDAEECKTRYESLSTGSARPISTPWTEEEDQTVRDLVRTKGKLMMLMLLQLVT